MLQQKLDLSSTVAALSHDRLRGDHGDQCQRAGAPPPGGVVRLHQEAIHSAEEEKAGLRAGLQRVSAAHGHFL